MAPLRGVVSNELEKQWNASGNRGQRQVALRWTDAAIPGGLRALAADGLWLRVYCAWAAHDAPRTEMLIHLTTMVDDRPLEFWINGARIIACDIPEWGLSAGEPDRIPSEVRRRIVQSHACAGLRYLESARRCHPDSAAIWVEEGNIQLYRLRDPALAAESYRHAAELPGAPYYAARIYAELLRRLGRDQTAYAWLIRIHPTLPPDDEAAMSGLVLGRIRELEMKLGVPARERYRPPLGSPVK
jgi:hypothetical protein